MQALILAGGFGTRLRSVVDDRPKPMADAGGRPFLEHQIEFLKAHGVAHLVLCVGYLHDHVREYFGDGERWGVEIDYSIEEVPLGTGGALKHAEKHVRGAFLALNGDSFLDVDLGKLMGFHEAKKAGDGRCVGTIALTQVRRARDYGSVVLDDDHAIRSFEEKVAGSNGVAQVNAGIYVLEPEILSFVPSSGKVSLEREIFPSVLEDGRRLFGYLADGFFVDIGTPAGYRRFQQYVEEGSR